MMTTAELIYQQAREVFGFVEFLKEKRLRAAESRRRENKRREADMSELDQFGSVYDGNFDRGACYDRPVLRYTIGKECE